MPITPPRRLIRGILVTAAGQRFINEDAYYGRIGQECLFRHDGRMFLVVDTAIYERNLAAWEQDFVTMTKGATARTSRAAATAKPAKP